MKQPDPRATSAARAARHDVAAMLAQLAALTTMTVAELATKYREVFGEPSRSRNKDYLRKKLAFGLQELAEGGLSERALARVAELAPDGPIRWRRPLPPFPVVVKAPREPAGPTRDPRLPEPGTTITRSYRGVDHTVTVLDNGFEHQGTRHASLSKIARAITGTNWNGFLFFGLDSRAGKGAAATTEARA